MEKCTCGHPKEIHVDDEFECCDVTCNCKDFEEACEICGGTGKITTYTRSEETGYNFVPDDIKPCTCQLEKNNKE